MATFALITEGYTDQLALDAVLLGALKDWSEEPEVQYLQPDLDQTQRSGLASHGGWTLVFRALRQRDHLKALQFNDFVVIHIDTDVCEEPGFDVPRMGAQGPLTPLQLAEATRLRLIQEMGGEQTISAFANRLIFAVAVDSIECWLMPLLFQQHGKQSKTTGCLTAANKHLCSRDRLPLERSGNKQPKAYAQAFKSYRKPKNLLKGRSNPSLALFLDQLQALSPRS